MSYDAFGIWEAKLKDIAKIKRKQDKLLNIIGGDCN
jgi:hypothetical protein